MNQWPTVEDFVQAYKETGLHAARRTFLRPYGENNTVGCGMSAWYLFRHINKKDTAEKDTFKFSHAVNEEFTALYGPLFVNGFMDGFDGWDMRDKYSNKNGEAETKILQKAFDLGVAVWQAVKDF